MARKPIIIAAGAAALSLAAPGFAQAAPAVTNTNDNGSGSLRAAIAGAAPGETITSGQLDVNKNLTLDGANARTTIITAGGRNFRVISNSGPNVTLRDLTITGGSPDTEAPDCTAAAGSATSFRPSYR